MSSPRPFAKAARRAQSGLSLIELMVGMLIGLLATLAVTHVLVSSEGQKRSATSGSDAQVNGALALAHLQRTIRSAGYGFAAAPGIVGCELQAAHSGIPVDLPERLVPVQIERTAGEPDRIRVLSSGKKTFSIPLRVVMPGYKPGDLQLRLSSIRGIETGDLLLAAVDASSPCEMFRVTGILSATEVAKGADKWNGGPTGNYSDGSIIINMGRPIDVRFAVTGGALRSTSLRINADGDPSYDPSPVELFPDIVNLRALYGKDNDGNGTIDAWDNTDPATPADWLKVVAIRVAVVSRVSQYEKEEVTFGDVEWDVGTGIPVDGSADCDGSKCLTLEISGDDEDDTTWKHYRYRVFETVVPLRNMLWNS